MIAPHLVTQHMGALHPVEQALVLLLAFGPFVLLALVVWLRRRAERREDARQESQADR
jgi:HAMP domain-containing protein